MNICGAKAKSTGKPCQRLPCKNGKCKLHGGKSTGPKTEAGRLKCGAVNFKHGRRSKAFLEEKKYLKGLIRRCDAIIGGML